MRLSIAEGLSELSQWVVPANAGTHNHRWELLMEYVYDIA